MELIRFVEEAYIDPYFGPIDNPEVEICAIGSVANPFLDIIIQSKYTHSLLEKDTILPFSAHPRGNLQLRIVLIDPLHKITPIEQEYLDSHCLLKWAIVIGKEYLKLAGYSICTMPESIPNFDLFIVNSVMLIIGRGLIGIDIVDVRAISENTQWLCSTILNANNPEALRTELQKMHILESVTVKGVLFMMNLPETKESLLTVEEIIEIVAKTSEVKYGKEARIIVGCHVIPDLLAEQGVPASVMICWTNDDL